MPEVAWMGAEEVMQLIAYLSTLVQDMSIPEAAVVLDAVEVSEGVYVTTAVNAIEAVGSAGTAIEAIGGTAATGGAAVEAANLTLYTTASGTTAVGGLGSIALPAAACCLAAAGGYAIGNVTGEMIDKAFPDFFDGLFCSVSEFLTGDERSLAFIFDEKGEVYMPEASQQAIDAYLKQQLSQRKPDSVIVDSAPIYFKQFGLNDTVFVLDNIKNYSYWRADSIMSTQPLYQFAFHAPNSNSINVVICSKEPFEISYYEHQSDNEKGYGPSTIKANYLSIYKGHQYVSHSLCGPLSLDTLVRFPSINLPLPSESSSDVRDMIVEVLYGNAQSNSSIPNIGKFERPDKPKIEVPSKYPSWVPVPLPTTYPSKLPLETPDPNSDPDPSKITPYLPQPQPYPDEFPVIKPVPNPDPIVIPTPVPQPQPTPPPDPDPSKDPVPKPVPTPTPTPKPPAPQPTPLPPIPVIPPIGEGAGLLHVYNPTGEQINEFGKWLWTTFSGDLLDTLAKLFNNPMDAVIGLHELYCTPSTGSSTTIKAGFLDSGVTSRLVSSRYVEINCGAITVPEYWGNYLDYSPYTKVFCYLPFIGIVELNADDIIGHGVQVLYKVDSYNGSCIAMIITAKTPKSEGTIYQFSGNCAVEVPITSGMKSAVQTALIGAATCAIGAAGAGLAGAAITDAAIVGGAKRGLNSKNTVAHSGSFGSSYGAMGIKKPYIIVKRPMQKKIFGYNKHYGYPAHKMVTIGNCSGYLRAKEVEVKSSTATEEEKKRIEILLKEGVYV